MRARFSWGDNLLLRRITKHVTDQNWFAVGIDFCIVVIGVFIGIQVANWNAARGDRAAEVRYLEALLSDVAASIVHLEHRLSEMEEQQVLRRRLYEYSRTPDGTPLPDDIDDLLQGGLFYIARVDVSQNAFVALTNSGEISLIQDAKLVTALQELDPLIDGADRWQEETFLFTYEFSDPFLIQQISMEAISKTVALGNGDTIEWIRDGDHPDTLPSALQSLAFRNMLIYHTSILSGRIISTQALLEKYRETETLIEDRQARLGVTT